MVDSAFLKKIGVLGGLSDEDLDDIAHHVTPVSVEKGSYLFYRGDASTGVYLVAKGSLQIIIDNDSNKEIIVYTIYQGDIVGEMTMFTEARRTATAIALEECKLYKIKNAKFIELMGQYPAIGVNLLKILIERLQAANNMIERLGTMDGGERVISFLKSLVMREGALKDGFYYLPRKPTYRQISQRLGLSEKTVYRTMSGLAHSGAIKIRGRQLFIKPSALTVQE